MATGKTFDRHDMILSRDSPRLGYVGGGGKLDETSNVVSIGQRKLFISDLTFIVNYVDLTKVPNPQILVIGAYHGTHFHMLSQMWPECSFHLYDPKFGGNKDTHLQDLPNVFVYPKLFGDDEVTEWKARQERDKNIYIISDIRRLSNVETEAAALKLFNISLDDQGRINDQPDRVAKAREWAKIELEKEIWKDMLLQQEWVLSIDPIYASLKFRLPYPLDSTDNRSVQYLKGTVWKQPWVGQASTETRLVPSRNADGQYESGDWNLLEMDDWMSYHKRVTRRLSTYRDVINNTTSPLDPPELLIDYDSTFEAESFASFLRYRGSINNLNMRKAVQGLSRLLTLSLHNNSLQSKRGPMVTLEGSRLHVRQGPASAFRAYQNLVDNDPTRAAGTQVHKLIKTKDDQLKQHVSEQSELNRQKVAARPKAAAAPTDSVAPGAGPSARGLTRGVAAMAAGAFTPNQLPGTAGRVRMPEIRPRGLRPGEVGGGLQIFNNRASQSPRPDMTQSAPFPSASLFSAASAAQPAPVRGWGSGTQ